MTRRTTRSEVTPLTTHLAPLCLRSAPPASGLQWKWHEADVAAPWDAADFPGQSRLHDRQRYELGCRDLVHPAGHSFGGVAGYADRPADASLHAAATLHRRAHRPRRPPPLDDVARWRTRRYHPVRRNTGA